MKKKGDEAMLTYYVCDFFVYIYNIILLEKKGFTVYSTHSICSKVSYLAIEKVMHALAIFTIGGKCSLMLFYLVLEPVIVPIILFFRKINK